MEHAKPTTRLYTWRFYVGYNPHSITVLAENPYHAMTKALRCVEEGKILSLCGPYTMSIKDVAAGPNIRVGYDKQTCEDINETLANYVKKTSPTVTSIDCVISASALDG